MDTVEEGLWSADEAARHLGVMSSTLMTWRSLNKGPRFSKIGRRVFYKPANVIEWLNGREIDPEQRRMAGGNA